MPTSLKKKDIYVGGYYTIEDNGEYPIIVKVKFVLKREPYNIRGALLNPIYQNFYRDTTAHYDDCRYLLRHSTEEEISWIDTCIRENKFVPLKDVEAHNPNNYSLTY